MFACSLSTAVRGGRGYGRGSCGRGRTLIKRAEYRTRANGRPFFQATFPFLLWQCNGEELPAKSLSHKASMFAGRVYFGHSTGCSGSGAVVQQVTGVLRVVEAGKTQ